MHVCVSYLSAPKIKGRQSFIAKYKRKDDQNFYFPILRIRIQLSQWTHIRKASRTTKKEIKEYSCFETLAVLSEGLQGSSGAWKSFMGPKKKPVWWIRILIDPHRFGSPGSGSVLGVRSGSRSTETYQ